MTTVDVETSPLQAAREWRGTTLVSAAQTSGLHLGQADALESGDLDAFGSVDEMVAAAVVYGATLGIGRDEAAALFDRTVSRTPFNLRLPDATSRAADIDDAGAGRSTKGESVTRATNTEAFVAAVAVSSSIALAASPRSIGASGMSKASSDRASARPPRRAGSQTRRSAGRIDGRPRVLVTSDDAPVERWKGEGGNDRWNDDVSRSRSRSSSAPPRHAPLLAAVGAVLIALVVGIASAIGGGDEPASGDGARGGPPASSAAKGEEADAVSPAPKPRRAAKPARPAAATASRPVLARSAITIAVLNDGRTNGRADAAAAQLESLGYRRGDVGNAPDKRGEPRIVAPKGLEREARRLGGEIGIANIETGTGGGRVMSVYVV